MEKMDNTAALELFEAMKDNITNGIYTVEYPIGDKTFSIDVSPYGSIADINAIVQASILGAYTDGEYNDYYMHVILARCFVDYFTNMPVPTIVDENGEETSDLGFCYELVFGFNGLYFTSSVCEKFLSKILEYINRNVQFKGMHNTKTEAFFGKALDLYNYATAEVQDIINNPMRQESIIEEIGKVLESTVGGVNG